MKNHGRRLTLEPFRHETPLGLREAKVAARCATVYGMYMHVQYISIIIRVQYMACMQYIAYIYLHGYDVQKQHVIVNIYSSGEARRLRARQGDPQQEGPWLGADDGRHRHLALHGARSRARRALRREGHGLDITKRRGDMTRYD